MLTRKVATVLAGFLIASNSFGQGADSAVDFQQQIRPLLVKHCVSCHGPEKQKGNLRLDQERYARRTGSLGLPVLGAARTDSELYSRLTSQDEDYRMPRGETDLSTDEIELFGRWIDDGSPWSGFVLEPTSAAQRNRHSYWRARGLALVEYAGGWLAASAIVGGILLVIMTRRYLLRSVPKERNRVPVSWFLIVFLIIALGGLRAVYRGQGARTSEEWRQKLERLRAELSYEDELKDTSGPKAIRPLHPSRMGGRYYRGNDERDPQLFNSGFYLTSTFDIELRNDEGGRLAWGDPVPDALWLTVTISRAQGASLELFSPEIMNRAFMSSEWINDLQGMQISSAPVRLSEIEPGNRWLAKFPILAPMLDQRSTAEIYLCFGLLEGRTNMNAKAHYGIFYDIFNSGGVIGRNSELWMGAIPLSAKVLYPKSGEISLPEWFDFRPIPQIEGANSQDSKLLGIDGYAF